MPAKRWVLSFFSQKKQNPFALLPNELIVEILKYLDKQSFLNFSRTNKRHHSLFTDNSYWSPRLKASYGITLHHSDSFDAYKIISEFKRARSAPLGDDEQAQQMIRLYQQIDSLPEQNTRLSLISLSIFIKYLFAQQLEMIMIRSDLSYQQKKSKFTTQLQTLKALISVIRKEISQTLSLDKAEHYTLLFINTFLRIPENIFELAKRQLELSKTGDNDIMRTRLALELTRLKNEVSQDNEHLYPLCLASAYSSEKIRNWLLAIYENPTVKTLLNQHDITDVIIEDLQRTQAPRQALRQ